MTSKLDEMREKASAVENKVFNCSSDNGRINIIAKFGQAEYERGVEDAALEAKRIESHSVAHIKGHELFCYYSDVVRAIRKLKSDK